MASNYMTILFHTPISKQCTLNELHYCLSLYQSPEHCQNYRVKRLAANITWVLNAAGQDFLYVGFLFHSLQRLKYFKYLACLQICVSTIFCHHSRKSKPPISQRKYKPKLMKPLLELMPILFCAHCKEQVFLPLSKARPFCYI